MLNFEWNDLKNQINIKKHNLDFETAKEAFYDDNSLVMYDKLHSKLEDRYYLLGMTKSLKVVAVIYCIREKETIRIISARYATRKEILEYEKNRN